MDAFARSAFRSRRTAARRSSVDNRSNPAIRCCSGYRRTIQAVWISAVEIVTIEDGSDRPVLLLPADGRNRHSEQHEVRGCPSPFDVPRLVQVADVHDSPGKKRRLGRGPKASQETQASLPSRNSKLGETRSGTQGMVSGIPNNNRRSVASPEGASFRGAAPDISSCPSRPTASPPPPPHPRNTFITSSPRWLITLTATRPVDGRGNARDVSLLSDAHASSSISAFSVVLRAL